MKTFSFYHAATGAVHGAIFRTSDPERVHLNAPADHVAIEGELDSLSHRVDVERLAREDSDALTTWDGEGPRPAPPVATAAHVIDFIPPRPTQDHLWDHATKRWALSPAATERAAAATAARARVRELIEAQHDLIRRMVLAPDAATREALAALDGEVSQLRASVAPSR